MLPARFGLLAAGLLAGVPLSLLAVPAAAPSPAAAVAPVTAPEHTLVVSGDGVGIFPAFDPTVERYAVTTTAATGGTVTLHASTSDPAGVVRVDGGVAANGTATVTGLSAGDEVSVFIEDSAGVEVHSLVYLPAGFPALVATGPGTGLAPGVVGLTLNPIVAPGPRFVTTVDRNGVPTHVRVAPDAYDLKDQPDGSITYSEPTTTPGRTGEAVVVLDPQWHVVRRLETDGLVNTDLHDSILEPDGSSWLMAYEPHGVDQTDSVIQHVDAAGHELFRWDSQGLQAESVAPVPSGGGRWDYAHMNSMQVLPDGDVIASFRHLSAVLRIAGSDHDGFQSGAIEWRLGGRDSDFTFVDDPDGGPCAQHTASLLPNGHVLVFDDGSDGSLSKPLCVDQGDPDGPAVTRQHSRVAEYALDPLLGTATLVWSYAPAGYYSWFMGSAARLTTGSTLVGWAADTKALAEEVDSDDNVLWRLRLADPKPAPPPISYRASLMEERDAEPPDVGAVSLAEGATYVVGQAVPVDFRCTDRGGSSLRSCGGDLRPGGALDTSTPGVHTLHLAATDGAGNRTTVTRGYTVTATYQPRWTVGLVRASLRGPRVSSLVRVVNDGTFADTFALRGARGSRRLTVHYKVGHLDVTSAVLAGTFRSGLLQPGESFALRVVVARTDRTRVGAKRTFTVGAQSTADPSRSAFTAVVVKARRA